MTVADVSEPITGWGRPSLGDDLRLRLLFFGACHIDRTWDHRIGDDAFWRIYRNAQNGAAVTSAGTRYELRAGEVWLIPPWSGSRTSCTGTVGHIHAHVEIPQWPQELVRKIFPRPFRVPDRTHGDALRVLAGELAEQGVSAERCWRTIAACASIFAAACATVPARARAQLLPNNAADRLAELRARIEYDLDQPLSNHGLAHAVGISEPTLVRRFREMMGTSPARFIFARRIAAAAELLAGDMPIAAIAQRCGFADRHSFSKAFRRVTGKPPAAFRRDKRGEAD